MSAKEQEKTVQKEGEHPPIGQLLIFIGPQGGGKTSVLDAINEQLKSSKLTTITDREQRPTDKEGEYLYLSKTEFQQKNTEGALIFVDTYGVNHYANTKKELDEVLMGQTKSLIVDVPRVTLLFDELTVLYGQETAQKLLTNTYIFYIGVPTMQAIHDRYFKREGKDETDKQTWKSFRARLQSDIKNWKALQTFSSIQIIDTDTDPLQPVIGANKIPVYVVRNEDNALETTVQKVISRLPLKEAHIS